MTDVKKLLETANRTIETLTKENKELEEKLGILIDRIDSVRNAGLKK